MMNWITNKIRQLYYSILLRIAFGRKPNESGTFDIQPTPGFREVLSTWEEIEEEYMLEHPPFSGPYPKFSDWLKQNYLPPVRKPYLPTNSTQDNKDLEDLINELSDYELMGMLNHHIEGFPTPGPIDTPDFLHVKMVNKAYQIYLDYPGYDPFTVIEYSDSFHSGISKRVRSYKKKPLSLEVLMQQIKNAKRFKENKK